MCSALHWAQEEYAGSYRGLHSPHVRGCAQLPGFVRKEAHFAAAVPRLCAHLRAVLGRVQVPLVHSMRVGACTALQHKTPHSLSPLSCSPTSRMYRQGPTETNTPVNAACYDALLIGLGWHGSMFGRHDRLHRITVM